MPDKKTIAILLRQTRDARLALEIAAWIHDLDKAGWPFAAYRDLGHGIGYNHNQQPDRSSKADWNWAKDWLNNFASPGSCLLEKGYTLTGLLPPGSAEVKLRYCDGEKELFFSIDPSNSANPKAGDVTELFKIPFSMEIGPSALVSLADQRPLWRGGWYRQRLFQKWSWK